MRTSPGSHGQMSDEVRQLIRDHPTEPPRPSCTILPRLDGEAFDDDRVKLVNARFMDGSRMGKLCATRLAGRTGRDISSTSQALARSPWPSVHGSACELRAEGMVGGAGTHGEG